VNRDKKTKIRRPLFRGERGLPAGLLVEGEQAGVCNTRACVINARTLLPSLLQSSIFKTAKFTEGVSPVTDLGKYNS
jgi:hypothetical protein